MESEGLKMWKPEGCLKELVGKTFSKVYAARKSAAEDWNELHLETADGEHWRFYHEQDCCEDVVLEDISGDLQDLVGQPLLVAEECSNHFKGYDYNDSNTYTFYILRTLKGTVVLRWLGQSSGYYSESVYLERADKNEI